MVNSTHLAIDIALLLPAGLRQRLTALNHTLRPPPNGFSFDSTHLPHLTLVQQFARRKDLEEITEITGEILSAQAPLELVTTDVSCAHVSSTLGIGLTHELGLLHRRLMHGLEPFVARDRASAEAAPNAFWSDDEPPRRADIEWVAQFRLQSAFERFDAHITIGAGALAAQIDPTRFVATEVALCHLGRFCTCRRVLSAWTLTAP